MAKLKCLTLFLYAAVFSSVAMADDNVRDGRPCLSGICVGDEISTLSKIKWQTASYNGKPITSLKTNDASVKSLLTHFAPSAAATVKAAAPYLMLNVFDAKAIPKLAQVKGFCDETMYPFGMRGNFISDSGHHTEVVIFVVTGDDPSNQSLQVTNIERVFPSEYTREQINELSKQLAERYQGVKQISGMGGSTLTEPTWEFDIYARKLKLRAPESNHSTRKTSDQLKKYPGCGKSLKID
jgi:hypothetical protein